MKKIIFVLLIVVIVVGLSAYLYIYKDHRDIAGEKAAYEIEAAVLSSAFLNTPEEASSKYVDKTLLLSGKVTETEDKGITLNNAVYCEFAESGDHAAFTEKTIVLKGRCIGYDELLEIVKLDQCTIVN